MDEIIDERQEDINKISAIMNDINDMGKDFNLEVDRGGEKLEAVNKNLDLTAENTKKAD